MKPRFLSLLLLGLALAGSALAAPLKPVTLSAPGPRNLSYLPIDLISKLGVDRELGYELRLLHTGGGAVALNNLVTRNADFAVAGAPAAMALRANGGDVSVIAAVNDAPLFVLMVRAGLRPSVKRIADLKGRTIGVNTSTKNSKTTSQQLLELLLQSGGLSSNQVRIVPAGQSWEEQSSLLVTGTVDAVMGDEPFASRLLADNQVFFLANLADPGSVKGIAGTGFLHAALETRGDVIGERPNLVRDMVEMLRRTLSWMAGHKPEEIVARLEISDPQERQALLGALKRYANAYSRDGRFSSAQLAETDRFFHAGGGDPAVSLATMSNFHWAGRKP